MYVCLSRLLNNLISQLVCGLWQEIKQKQMNKSMHPFNRLNCLCFSVGQVLRPGARYEVSVSGVRKGNESGAISTEFTTGEDGQYVTIVVYAIFFSTNYIA